MSKEIEKKFLVNKDKFEYSLKTRKWYFYPVKQAYIDIKEEKLSQIRVAIFGYENYELLRKINPEIKYKKFTARINIKGLMSNAIRDEYSYKIPIEEAEEIFNKCKYKIFKERYITNINNLIWEVDVFKGENEGLIIAEVELDSPDQEIILPEFVTEEITDKPEYYCNSLAKQPRKE